MGGKGCISLKLARSTKAYTSTRILLYAANKSSGNAGKQRHTGSGNDYLYNKRNLFLAARLEVGRR
ncbi:hypothetical protein WN51_01149 [Melipona quadrifasciata]|uniref:Uncharacterized protein n=1 Tax=Melipona quadrifasciata TaxID=166423 RepID=A0A0N0BFF8_9HYME|nr:hypothetical protein WN51_01149 [Melipona quadrifasciata]